MIGMRHQDVDRCVTKHIDRRPGMLGEILTSGSGATSTTGRAVIVNMSKSVLRVGGVLRRQFFRHKGERTRAAGAKARGSHLTTPHPAAISARSARSRAHLPLYLDVETRASAAIFSHKIEAARSTRSIKKCTCRSQRRVTSSQTWGNCAGGARPRLWCSTGQNVAIARSNRAACSPSEHNEKYLRSRAAEGGR